MRYINVAALAALLALGFLASCASTSRSPAHSDRTHLSQTCNEIEGYPDCQDGYQIDPRG